jgi:hypothetical protein
VPRGIYPHPVPASRSVECPTCKVSAAVRCVYTRGNHKGEPVHGTHPARLRVVRAKFRINGKVTT